MSKRLLLALAIGALAIAACHSSPSPTPSIPPSSPTPNPSITEGTVKVTVNGTPQPGVPVQISTPRSTSSPRPGQPFDTKDTERNGKAHFFGLKPSQTYCWVALINPRIHASDCAAWPIWQAGPITLGT
jgi:hypothetical protein